MQHSSPLNFHDAAGVQMTSSVPEFRRFVSGFQGSIQRQILTSWLACPKQDSTREAHRFFWRTNIDQLECREWLLAVGAKNWQLGSKFQYLFSVMVENRQQAKNGKFWCRIWRYSTFSLIFPSMWLPVTLSKVVHPVIDIYCCFTKVNKS